MSINHAVVIIHQDSTAEPSDTNGTCCRQIAKVTLVLSILLVFLLPQIYVVDKNYNNKFLVNEGNMEQTTNGFGAVWSYYSEKCSTFFDSIITMVVTDFFFFFLILFASIYWCIGKRDGRPFQHNDNANCFFCIVILPMIPLYAYCVVKGFFWTIIGNQGGWYGLECSNSDVYINIYYITNIILIYIVTVPGLISVVLFFCAGGMKSPMC